MPSSFDERFQALAVPRFVRSFGQPVPYTKCGEARANTLTLIVTSKESRVAESNGIQFEVFRIQVSGELSTGYDPKSGDRLQHGGKTWDYAGLAREVTGGMAHAYFESMNLDQFGVGQSPV